MDFFVQDSWRLRQNLTINAGLRYAVQPAFRSLNNSYSIPSLEDVWGISGYVPGCNPSAASPDTCNLFKPGVTPGRTPQFQNLGEGVKAYNTDFDNFAPSGSTGHRAKKPASWRRSSASRVTRRCRVDSAAATSAEASEISPV